ncbi:MAG: hypothetical protein ACKPIC_01635, partial [Microcystis panniformis]
TLLDLDYSSFTKQYFSAIADLVGCVRRRQSLAKKNKLTIRAPRTNLIIKPVRYAFALRTLLDCFN